MKLRWAVLPFTLAALTSGTAEAAPPGSDPWFGPDKALHFTASTILSSGGYGLSSYYTQGIAARVAFGAGLGVTVGAVKELIDLTGSGDPSWRDFAWDVVGTAVGVGIALTIDVATRPTLAAPAY